MATAVTGSLYITKLDSKIVASLCGGKFFIDVTPSSFTGSGGAALVGVSIKIENEKLGVVYKNYPTSGYDINPPLSAIFEYNIPQIAGNYQYGTYKITVRLTDENDVDWFLEKSVNICAPDKKNKNKKTACLNATIKGNCKDGRVVILIDEAPTYKSLASSSRVVDLDLYYPTESGLPPLPTTVSSFSVQLYEGEYKVTGTVCATYLAEDNISFEVLYDVKCSKIIKCVIDVCCVAAQLDELYLRLDSTCTNEEKTQITSDIQEALALLDLAKIAAECGNDPSDYISKLEDLLGCVCTCNCNAGTPIIDNTPSNDYVFVGCGFTVNTVGLTKTITLDNKTYTLNLEDVSGVFALSAPADGEACDTSQTLTVNNTVLTAMMGASRGYKSVVGTITQTGTNAPTLNIWQNDTTIVFGVPLRTGVGDYTLPITGLTLNASTVGCLTGQDKSVITSMGVESAGVFYVQTVLPSEAFADNKLVNTPFEIRVKN